MLPRILTFLAWGLLAPLAALADPKLDEILAALRRAELERRTEIRETAYIAEARVIEWKDPGRTEVKRETVSLRRVYTREPDLVHNEYLSMTVDGRLLSAAEMQRELARQRGGRQGSGGGGGSDRFLSPLSPEAAELYDFRLLGPTEFEGESAWQLAFSPRKPGQSRMEGRALVSQRDYHVLYAEMVPSQLPGILEELRIGMRFAPVEGYWLPAQFRMEMRVRLSVLVTLVDRTLTIEDRYSGYRLNPGLEDSVFSAETRGSR
jgi:hypothetical protein